MKLPRTTSLSAAAFAAAAIVVAAAGAQDRPERRDRPPTDLSAAVKVTPSRAGTKQEPRGVAVSATSTMATERGSGPPIVTGFDLLFGRGFSWHGGAYATCSKRALDHQGPKGCPRESIMGSGTAIASAGGVDTDVAITFVNGGAERLLAHARFEYPARAQETLVVKATDMAGRWRYKDALRAPKSLQVVAGVPVHTTGLKFTLGGKPYARRYITTTSCPSNGWAYRITAHYLYDLTGQTAEDTVGRTIPCTS